MFYQDYFINEKHFFRKSQILPCSSLETSVRSTAKTAKRIQPTHRSISRLIFASIHRDANCAQMERSSALARIGSRDYLEGKIPQWGGVIIRKLGGPEDVVFLKALSNKILHLPKSSCYFENSQKQH